ncbi:uncharacterized protein isoform X2 [Choristoneura fumiferana]|uniref:uncharacterized protein isoform X2 n=1 Tax=Choristoneura fumiferana TaxID=7141 RepID=UPI003D159E32
MGNRSIQKVKRKRKRLSELREHMRNIRVPKRSQIYARSLETSSENYILFESLGGKKKRTEVSGPDVSSSTILVQTIRNCPKKLSVLCKNVIRKYNLTKPKLENKQKFVEPESCTIIGGKPLRDRQKIAPSIASTSSQPPKKRKVYKARKKNEPSKPLPKINVDIERKVKPRKEYFPEILVSTTKVSPECQIRIKEELEPIADNQDPLAPEAEDYTVIVKEEFEADEETRLVAQSTATSETITMPTLVPSRNVAPSRSSLPSATSGPPLMTVVADEMQIFANNLAEQLRTFPIDRALLLQLEIQTMIDNERQLLLH